GAQQHRGRRAVGSARDVGAGVDAVAEIGVEASGRPEHHAVAAAAPPVGVRRRVRPRPVGNPSVGLHLDDDRAHAPPGEGGAEQPVRGRDRVDYQLACTHPPNLPRPQTWQTPGCRVAKEPRKMHAIDPAATAWLLASTALVLLMTPGLAIFYGGMVRTT